jgi:hypothetical protein
MTTSNNNKREGAWAKPVEHLEVGDLPDEAINMNVDGRQLMGPLNGFGQLWQKTYSVRLSGADASPTEVISVWKADFPGFWPEGNRFYGSLTGIAPGEVAVLNLAGPGNMALSTGIMVIYVDDESFSFMTPQGHIFSAMITFSAMEEEGDTVAQVQALIRASDPFYEMGCRVGVVHKNEDAFWKGTLENLAAYFGVDGQVKQNVILVDNKIQWSKAGNIWHNAAIRTALNMPVRAARRIAGK